MKQVVLQVEDSAFEKFLDFMHLCSMVEVISTSEFMETRNTLDKCFYTAISELRRDKVFRTKGDYAYIMMVLNDEVIKGFFFFSPLDYLTYLSGLGFDGLPGKSTLYDTNNKVIGHYPNWEFLDNPDNTERLRRNNIVVRFLNAFNKAKRMLSEGYSEK